MYLDHFRLTQAPFDNNLDPKWFYLSEPHREVLAALLYFIRSRKSFALLTGDVGTGKSTLISCLLNMLPINVRPVLINHPDVSHLEIIYFLCRRLGVRQERATVLQLLTEARAILGQEAAAGRRTVLIVDEAQLLSDRVLENIRLLSNIETRSEKLLQILLVGQNELSVRLGGQGLRQLRQRIQISRRLTALDPDQTIAYVDHRLRLAGSSFPSCFQPSCGSLLVRLSRGVPRRINHLCDTALLICSLEKAPRVTRRMLRQADRALTTGQAHRERSHSAVSAWWPRPWTRRLLRAGAVLALAAGLLMLGLNRAAGGF